MAPFSRAEKFAGTGWDYLQLFRADAPWPKSAARVNVFQITAPLLSHESDATLKAVFADLKRRHIELGMELGLLAGRDASGNTAVGDQIFCGRGMEGYANPGTVKFVMNKIKQNGGDLRYLAMDEPLWYGHHVQGKMACKSSMESLAREIAGRVKEAREVFPDLQLGDTEPLAPSNPPVPDWTGQIIAWTRVYQQVSGDPFSFVRADIVWTGPWQRELANLKNQLKAQKIKLGVIYDGGGDGKVQNDQNWTETTIQRCRQIESDPRLKPDVGIVESWVRWPSRLLPEDRLGTLTNVFLQCVSAT